MAAGHLALGAAVGAGTAVAARAVGLPLTDEQTVAWITVLTVGADVPDLDHPSATISRVAFHGVVGGSLGLAAGLAARHFHHDPGWSLPRWALVGLLVTFATGYMPKIHVRKPRRRDDWLTRLLLALAHLLLRLAAAVMRGLRWLEETARENTWQHLVCPLTLGHRGRTHTWQFAVATGAVVQAAAVGVHARWGLIPTGTLHLVGAAAGLGCLVHLAGDDPTMSKVPWTMRNAAEEAGHCLRWFYVGSRREVALTNLVLWPVAGTWSWVAVTWTYVVLAGAASVLLAAAVAVLAVLPEPEPPRRRMRPA